MDDKTLRESVAARRMAEALHKVNPERFWVFIGRVIGVEHWRVAMGYLGNKTPFLTILLHGGDTPVPVSWKYDFPGGLHKHKDFYCVSMEEAQIDWATEAIEEVVRSL